VLNQPIAAQKAAIKIKTPPPDEVPAEQISLKETKVQSKTSPPPDEAVTPSPTLITTTSYPFTSTTGIPLEDMSSGTTTLIGPNTDDNNSAAFNIGFDFWYDGVRFTQFGVNANGFARLGAAPTGSSFTNNLATTTNAPKIAPYWDDLCVPSNGKVHFKTVGSAPSRKVVVEWQNMQISRGLGCTGTGNGTFQMWLFENIGVVEFVYGAIQAPNLGVDGGYSNGVQSGVATNFASITTATDSVSYTVSNNTQSNAITAGKAYLFTPQTATAPSGLNFTGTSGIATTLNWTDNSTNELGFVIYRSTDGVNFSFVAQTPADTTSFADNGLSPGTQYFYQVSAVTEGALSSAAANNVTTNAAGNISSTVAGGNWSSTATWVGGVVPTASDNVTIVDGATVTIDTAALAFTVNVGSGGTPAVLQFEPAVARTLTTGGNVMIATNGTMQSAVTGTVTTHVLSVGGNLTNNGVLDLSTNANTAGANLSFTTSGNTTFGGSGATTDVMAITVNKGSSSTSVVELNTTNFTVQGASTDVVGFLTLTNGTFKLSGSFSLTNRVFATATYVIPATAGFWLNNANVTVTGQAGGTTSQNNGLFRLTQGVFGIGVTGADGFGGGNGAQFIIEGGTINATRIDPQSPVTWTQSAGTVNVGVVANTRSNFGTFELFSTNSTFNFTGGVLNLVQASVGATPIDYQVLSANDHITGGTLNVGTAATATNFNFRIRGFTPALVIDNTNNAKTATFTLQTIISGNVTVNPGTTFALNGFLVATRGGTFTNNGTVTGTLSGSRFYFYDTIGTPLSYTGSGTAGTIAAPLASVDFDSIGGMTFDPASSNLIVSRIALFRGNVTNTNKLTLGVGGTSIGTTQIGNNGAVPTSAGNFDVAPTFNLGTGGQVAFYARTTTSRVTGIEINPTRSLTTLLYDDNDATHSLTIAGGDLTLTNTAVALNLINGRIVTGSNTLIVSSGSAIVNRTNGFVDGNLRKNFAAAVAKGFEVGTANGFSPAAVGVISGAPTDVTVKAVQGKQPNIPGANALQRYWQVTAPAGVTADLLFQYFAADVVGTESNYQVLKYAGSFSSPAGSAIDTLNHRVQVPAQAAFTADWTAGEPGSLVGSPGSLQFSLTNYNVAENAGTAAITVNRIGGSTGPASVNFSTSGGTAVGGGGCSSGVDYVVNTGTLNWVDGDSAAKTFNVTICNDTIFENDETVNLNLSGVTGATLGVPSTATLTIVNDDPAPPTPGAGDLLITEFRFRGPAGANSSTDEFIELYNNTASSLAVGSTDSLGYAVAASDGMIRCLIPNGTIIPSRNHYLCANSTGYSLSAYAAPDLSYATDIPDDDGIALFRTANTGNFNLGTRLDAVGAASVANPLYTEGTGLTSVTGTGEYSWFRSLASGLPRDTDNNRLDFRLVATDALVYGATQSQRGAPGPESLTSPVQRNAAFAVSLIDPSQPSQSDPNRVRDPTPGSGPTALGTVDIRRRFTNSTGAPITAFRIRIVEIATTGTPGLGFQADLRALTSGDTTANGGTILITGSTLESPSDAVNGGGLNSSLVVAIPGGSLAPGASMNVRVLLGVVQIGVYRFFVNVEALP
jgi:hypothetical protein